MFQMACILSPKCNFLHGYFRCLLPLETVNVEVNVKMMRGIHMLRRDTTTQVILCNPWSTRLCAYPSVIRKMKTHLELEGKICPKPRPQPQTQSQLCTSTPSQNNISLKRKIPGPKMADKKKRTRVPAKRRCKVRGIVQPLPTTPTMTMPMSPIPTPPVATSTASTQMPVVKLVATSILVTVYNLAQGNSKEFPTPEEDSKLRKFLPPPTSIHYNLNLYPMPQPSRLDLTPLGLTLCQPPQIYLMPGQIGQFSLCKPPIVKVEKTEVPPRVAPIPHTMV